MVTGTFTFSIWWLTRQHVSVKTKLYLPTCFCTESLHNDSQLVIVVQDCTNKYNYEESINTALCDLP